MSAENMAPARAACLERLRREDPERALAAASAPTAAAEGDLGVLYAFNLELARTPDLTREPIMGQIRLQWWREVLEEAADPARPVRRHETALPLTDLIRSGRLAAEDLLPLIDAREPELAALPHQRVADVTGMLDQGLGRMLDLSARLCGGPEPEVAALAAVARGYGWLGLWRSLPRQVALGRILLPAEALTRHGLSPPFDRRPEPAALQALAEEMLRPLLMPLRRAVDAGGLPGPLGVHGRLALRWAGRLEAVGWNPFALPPWRLPAGLVLRVMLRRWLRRG